MRILSILAIVGISAVGPVASRALTLQDLIDTNGAITVDDKVFSNFACAINSTGFSGPTLCSQIGVTGTALDSTHEQLQFNANFFASSPPPATNDILITYTITSLSGATIEDVELVQGSTIVIGTLTTASITETVTETLPIVFPSLANLATSTGTSLTASATFTPSITQAIISKDISLLSGCTTGSTCSVAFSITDQVFSQIPEPASLALLGSALFGLAFFARKRLAQG
jgi:hypothetical protein